jgi:hypothetical protein
MFSRGTPIGERVRRSFGFDGWVVRSLDATAVSAQPGRPESSPNDEGKIADLTTLSKA